MKTKLSFGLFAGLLACVATTTVCGLPLSVTIYSGGWGDAWETPVNNWLITPGAPYPAPGVVLGTDPSFSEVDTLSRFGWGSGTSPSDIVGGYHPFGQARFAADFMGSIYATGSSLPYVFGLTSDDGSTLFIDGGLVINNSGIHSPTTAISAPIVLAPGVHGFEVKFFETAYGPSGVRLDLPVGVNYVPDSGQWLWLAPILVCTVHALLRQRRRTRAPV